MAKFSHNITKIINLAVPRNGIALLGRLVAALGPLRLHARRPLMLGRSGPLEAELALMLHELERLHAPLILELVLVAPRVELELHGVLAPLVVEILVPVVQLDLLHLQVDLEALDAHVSQIFAHFRVFFDALQKRRRAEHRHRFSSDLAALQFV